MALNMLHILTFIATKQINKHKENREPQMRKQNLLANKIEASIIIKEKQKGKNLVLLFFLLPSSKSSKRSSSSSSETSSTMVGLGTGCWGFSERLLRAWRTWQLSGTIWGKGYPPNGKKSLPTEREGAMKLELLVVVVMTGENGTKEALELQAVLMFISFALTRERERERWGFIQSVSCGKWEQWVRSEEDSKMNQKRSDSTRDTTSCIHVDDPITVSSKALTRLRGQL